MLNLKEKEMNWNDLKKIFQQFHQEKVSKKLLVSHIREYQFSNNIKVVDKRKR